MIWWHVVPVLKLPSEGTRVTFLLSVWGWALRFAISAEVLSIALATRNKRPHKSLFLEAWCFQVPSTGARAEGRTELQLWIWMRRFGMPLRDIATSTTTQITRFASADKHLNHTAVLMVDFYTIRVQTGCCVVLTSWGTLGWGTMLKAGKSRVHFPKKSLHFPMHLIVRPALWQLCRLSL